MATTRLTDLELDCAAYLATLADAPAVRQLMTALVAEVHASRDRAGLVGADLLTHVVVSGVRFAVDDDGNLERECEDVSPDAVRAATLADVERAVSRLDKFLAHDRTCVTLADVVAALLRLSKEIP